MLLKHSLTVFACLAYLAPAAAQEFDCVIEARQSVDVRSQAEGVIESVLINRGETVKKGQLLARLSSGPELAAVNLARSRATMEGELKAAEARVTMDTPLSTRGADARVPAIQRRTLQRSAADDRSALTLG